MKHNGMHVIRNRYTGKCPVCGDVVEAFFGIAVCPISGGKWKTYHPQCNEELFSALSESETAAANKHMAEEAARKAKEEQAKAEHAELLAKLGINTKEVLNPKCVQSSWSDDSTWSHAYTGEGTLEEFRRALETRNQSSGFSLRWSEGVRVTGLDTENKVVHCSESIRLCD